MAYPEAGTPVFLISKQWIDQYKEYVFFKEIVRGSNPNMEEDHCKEKHPGPITNSVLLQDGSRYLTGTGDDPDFEGDVMDTYLRDEVRETADYELFGQALWDFVSERYGFDRTVRRFYTKG
jgi:hypothetical protein